MKKTDERDPPRDTPRDPSRDPWRVFVPVDRIPDTGLHREIEADEATRAALAGTGAQPSLVRVSCAEAAKRAARVPSPVFAAISASVSSASAALRSSPRSAYTASALWTRSRPRSRSPSSTAAVPDTHSAVAR